MMQSLMPTVPRGDSSRHRTQPEEAAGLAVPRTEQNRDGANLRPHPVREYSAKGRALVGRPWNQQRARDEPPAAPAAPAIITLLLTSVGGGSRTRAGVYRNSLRCRQCGGRPPRCKHPACGGRCDSTNCAPLDFARALMVAMSFANSTVIFGQPAKTALDPPMRSKSPQWHLAYKRCQSSSSSNNQGSQRCCESTSTP